MTLPHSHRYHEEINGRPYVIEVNLVASNRWRAQIARRPGATTTALMPFYGVTPDDAVRLLSDWLARATPAPRRPEPAAPTRSH